MVKWLLILWGFSGFSGFLMVLMVWNLISGRQSIRGLRQWSPTNLTSVWVQKGGRAFYDVNGQNIVQTDNETYESTIIGKKQTIIFGLHFMRLVHPHEQNPLQLPPFTWMNLHNLLFQSSLHWHRNTPMSVSTHLLPDIQLFADASQWPESHWCDDLLNGKWYHA